MISVNRPLDYEQIPNGLIYLTVMAKDAGNPPLNSTVPVTIEVFVSTQGCTGLALPGYGVVSASQSIGALSEPAVPTAQRVTQQTVPKAVC